MVISPLSVRDPMTLRRRQIDEIALVTAVATCLRLVSGGRGALRGDEMQLINIAALPSARDVIDFLAAHESHPPLLYLYGHVMHDWFGQAIAPLTCTVLVASILLPVSAWWLGTFSGVPGAGLLGGLLVAVSLPLSFLDVQVRPYGVLSLLLLFTAGAVLKGSAERGSGWRLGWLAGSLAMLYLHHLSLLLVAAEFVVALLITGMGTGARTALRRWLPAAVALIVLGLPDLWLLQRQDQAMLTAPSPGLWAAITEFGRTAMSFPGELMVPVTICIGVVLIGLPRRRKVASVGPGAASVFATGAMVTAMAGALLLGRLHRPVLAGYVVLTIAPLALAATGMAIAMLLVNRMRALAGGALLAMIGAITLSALFTAGAFKTNIDAIARLISAEYEATDLVVLAPRVSGAAFNLYASSPMNQIDYPVPGSATVYKFDHESARILDKGALAMTADSVDAAWRAGRRVWYVFPASWSDRAPSSDDLRVAPRSGVSAARVRGAELRGLLEASYGSANRTFAVQPAPWEQERFSAALYAPPAQSADVRSAGGH
jgi:hypothetical protein